MATTASGASTTLAMRAEAVVGTPPNFNFHLFSVSRYSLGATQNFLENDQIGQVRDAQHASRDIRETSGQLSVPVDLTDVGFWLTLVMGTPTTTGGPTNYTHVWLSNDNDAQTYSIEEQHEDLDTPLYFLATGVRGSSFNFRMEPRGHASMDVALIAQNIDNAATVSEAGTPNRVGTFNRFSQFENFIRIDPAGGTTWQDLDKQVAATLNFDNRLETVYYIGGGGQPGDINLQVPQLQGEFTARLADAQMFTLADAGTKFAAQLGWFRGASIGASVQALLFELRSIEIGTGANRVEGASGIEATFQYRGGAPTGSAALRVELRNQYNGAGYTS